MELKTTGDRRQRPALVWKIVIAGPTLNDQTRPMPKDCNCTDTCVHSFPGESVWLVLHLPGMDGHDLGTHKLISHDP